MSTPLPISQAYQPGRTVVALIKNPSTGLWWNTSTLAWASGYTPVVGSAFHTTLTDTLGIGDYTAAFPTQLAGMTVNVLTYDTDNLNNPLGQAQLTSSDTSGETSTVSSPSIVAVVNEALMFLGVGLITSLTEDSEAAERAAQVYDSTRLSLLRSHHWKFATFIDALALISGETATGWDYLYAYPSKCAMIRKIYPSTLTELSAYDFQKYYDLYRDTQYQWRQVISPTSFTKAIATDIETAYIEYTYDVTDPNVWDQNFLDAMVWALAAKLGHTLTGKSELATLAQNNLKGILSEAKRLDAQEDGSREYRTSSFQKARA